ncbi:MAG: peptidoglycan DD-metalloendopeptidase family protein [Bacteroidetes bacterium]|jgi:murein hydrolase activator|nr:peptidoglycan DD-metalloendopeptidase family protein [Bacteroidota bacterium]MBT3749882.1 peptidoglycan DD-metalloendopeptidase family protein [Bacteroidota bacterium]MBT4398404.1 peptidoglycan DD-metalloendopeptidase family protein [Bacteroidota bacterium]MBT4411826.1 peptidoglycan DD-metalloendopeptidase family protein [Bacteroidota bacterium]MBT7094335.1 peptidoglycan DD-metalloendopeptidase family protein [Bacteroidota bacterium]
MVLEGGKSNWRIVFTAAVILLISSCHLFAQDLTELREDRRNKLDEIQYTEKLLSETADNKKNQVNQVKLMNRQISNRESVIRSIRQELEYFEKSISSKEDTVELLQVEVKELKEEYGRMIVTAYMTRRSYDKAQYILAASDFNQAYKRIKYLQQYSRFRIQQAEEIKEKASELEIQVSKLENEKTVQGRLLNQRQKEIASLNNQKSNKDQFVKQLSRKEKELRKELRDKRQIYNQIENEIRRILAEAIGESSEGGDFGMTPEMKIISNEFGQNKGRHAWPVERGVITSKYGRHQHEVLKNIVIENSGIDITTDSGQSIRSVFEGKVNSIMSFKGANLTVVIQHGEYFTVYHGLVDVLVKKGDIVSRLEPIGKAFKADNSNRSQMQFQIWKGTDSVDPELWLAR